MRTETVFFNIESFNADLLMNGSKNSRLLYNDLPLVQRKFGCRRVVVGVDHATFPNSIYNINQYYNTIVFQGTTYTVAVGNYTVNSLMTHLQNLISGLTLTFNETTGKLTLAHETIETFTIAGSLLYILGGDDTVTYTSTYNVLHMPGLVDLRGTNRLVIRSPSLVCQNRGK